MIRQSPTQTLVLQVKLLCLPQWIDLTFAMVEEMVARNVIWIGKFSDKITHQFDEMHSETPCPDLPFDGHAMPDSYLMKESISLLQTKLYIMIGWQE